MCSAGRAQTGIIMAEMLRRRRAIVRKTTGIPLYLTEWNRHGERSLLPDGGCARAHIILKKKEAVSEELLLFLQRISKSNCRLSGKGVMVLR